MADDRDPTIESLLERIQTWRHPYAWRTALARHEELGPLFDAFVTGCQATDSARASIEVAQQAVTATGPDVCYNTAA